MGFLSSNFLRVNRAVLTNSLRFYSPPAPGSTGTSKNKGLRLVLLGAPGSGKGSFSKYISRHFDVPMISTGDIIRAEIKSGSEVGKKVQEIAHVGHLVPDEIVFSLLRKRLSHDDTTHGYILDGFPRRKEQAELLANLEGVSPPNVVVNIGLREDVLITKACARRVCSGCGQGYNLADVRDGEICMPAILPQKENICDNCSGLLIQRDDDVEETVRERLRVYHENAQPLVDFYTAKNLLVDWQVIKGLEDATKLLDTIDEELGKHRD